MLTSVAPFVAQFGLATIALIALSAINGALFVLNVSYSRKLWRRREALLKRENRLAPGPITTAMTDRFAKSATPLPK
jgi:hypothetical protein